MAEINEITIAKSWIAYELQQDSVIQAKIGDNFFYGVADPNAGDFYIVYNFVTGSLTKKLGQRRQLTRLLFDIKVYQRGRGNADLTTVANRIEQLFGYFINRNFQSWVFSSELDFPLDLPESDRERKDIWQGIGGTYRIAVAEGVGAGNSPPIGVNLSGARIVDEIPSGAINGSNATFTTAQNFVPESVEVTLNGLAQRKGAGFDYITTGNNTIIFSVSPDVGDTILVDYEVL